MEKLLYLHQDHRYLENYIHIIKQFPRTLDPAIFSPRAYAEFSGGGKFYDVPPLPLKNIGAHWLIRELARLNVRGFRPAEERFLAYCWVPRKCCFEKLGLGDQSKHEDLIVALKGGNGGKLPIFDYWFDIAICRG